MRSVSVSRGVVTVGAGAHLGDVYDALAEHGLTIPGGCGPSVGIAGLTSSDPHVKELVEKQREKLGAPNNVVRTHVWCPEVMLRWLDFYKYISKGLSRLSRVEREMIGVVVSAENRCVF